MGRRASKSGVVDETKQLMKYARKLAPGVCNGPRKWCPGTSMWSVVLDTDPSMLAQLVTIILSGLCIRAANELRVGSHPTRVCLCEPAKLEHT